MGSLGNLDYAGRRFRVAWIDPEGSVRIPSKAFLPAVLLSISISTATAQKPFDIVITNGHIIDGTGSPWYSGEVGIRDGRIAAIGNLAAARRTRTIDVHGKVVAPGFIDML